MLIEKYKETIDASECVAVSHSGREIKNGCCSRPISASENHFKNPNPEKVTCRVYQGFPSSVHQLLAY